MLSTRTQHLQRKAMPARSCLVWPHKPLGKLVASTRSAGLLLPITEEGECVATRSYFASWRARCVLAGTHIGLLQHLWPSQRRNFRRWLSILSGAVHCDGAGTEAPRSSLTPKRGAGRRTRAPHPPDRPGGRTLSLPDCGSARVPPSTPCAKSQRHASTHTLITLILRRWAHANALGFPTVGHYSQISRW